MREGRCYLLREKVYFGDIYSPTINTEQHSETMTDIPGILANPSVGEIDLDGTVEQTPPPTTGNSMATCIEQYKFDHRTKRSRQLDMIQRSMCAVWFNTDCVGIKKDVPIGVWPCTTYRLIPEQLRSIVDTPGALTRTVNTMTKTNEKLNTQCEKREAECIELRKDNANLLTQITSLTAQLAKRAWEFYTQKPTLLIGDSLIRDEVT